MFQKLNRIYWKMARSSDKEIEAILASSLKTEDEKKAFKAFMDWHDAGDKLNEQQKENVLKRCSAYMVKNQRKNK